MEDAVIALSPEHVVKLKKNKTIQLKPELFGSGMKLKLSKTNASKLRRAAAHSKGMRLQMTKEEMEASGFFDTAVSAVKSVAKKIPKPVIKKGVEMAVASAITAAAPELAAVAPTISKAVAPRICKATRACGVKKTVSLSLPHASMVAPALPASRPLVDVGNLAQGQHFII